MKKRIKKKLLTDKTYGGSLESLTRAVKNRKVMKALIKSGKINVSTIYLDVPYKDIFKK